MNFAEVIAELENLPDESQKMLMVWNDSGGIHVRERTKAVEELISCPLVEAKPATADVIHRSFKTAEMADICRRHGLTPPKRISKRRLAEWCAENAKIAFAGYSFAEAFKKKSNAAYSYLCRKFLWEETVHEKYPWGAKQKDAKLTVIVGENNKASSEYNRDRLYYFPEDEITAQLTLYGHNRCLGGFEAIQTESEGI